MKFRPILMFTLVSALLGGCATAPQLPIPVSKEFADSKSVKVGVVMTALPKVDTAFPGAACLLCLGAASLANRALTVHVQTLSHEDLPKLKEELARMLVVKGMDAVVINETIDLSKLSDVSTKQPNFAKLDHQPLKAKYGVDKLLVLNIDSLGVWRNYASYIPVGDPKAVFNGVGYLVNLNTNALEWYLPVAIQKSADLKWDEPPTFPGLTNAYFQVIELGRDSFTKPFGQ